MNTPDPRFTITETATLAQGNLVTWEDAEAAIIDYGRKWLAEYERWYRSINTFRSWLAMRAARITVGRNVALALATLRLNLYRQSRKRRGVQEIVTRNWPIGQLRGTRHGKLAWKRPRGRPPLPASVRIARELARRKAKRKDTSKPYKPKKPITAPPTMTPRPKGRGRPLGSGDGPDTRREPKGNWRSVVKERLKELAEEAAEEAVKQVGEKLADYCGEVAHKLGAEIHDALAETAAHLGVIVTGRSGYLGDVNTTPTGDA